MLTKFRGDADIEDALISPSFIADPYPVYEMIRQAGGAYRSPRTGAWLISRFEDVSAALRDWQHFSNEDRMTSLTEGLTSSEKTQIEPLHKFFAAKSLIHSDPPVHTRLRKLVAKSFTSNVVAPLAARVREIVDERLDVAAERGRMEIVADIALPVPTTIIAEMLGVPVSDRDQFVAWTEGILGVLGASNPSIETLAAAQTGYLSLGDYLRDLIRERTARLRAGGDDDLLTMMARAEDGMQLSEEEMVNSCVTILVGGFETTTSLITNAIYLLLSNPDQLADLRSHPELAADAAEEALRCESPLQVVPRRIAKSIEIADATLGVGETAFLMLGAANRDPERFELPDRFDIRRKNKHAAFGFGIHFCVGNPLARLEAPIVIRSIVERFPNLRPKAGKVDWNNGKPIVRRPVRYEVEC